MYIPKEGAKSTSEEESEAAEPEENEGSDEDEDDGEEEDSRDLSPTNGKLTGKRTERSTPPKRTKTESQDAGSTQTSPQRSQGDDDNALERLWRKHLRILEAFDDHILLLQQATKRQRRKIGVGEPVRTIEIDAREANLFVKEYYEQFN